jgi:hypothetical protein
LRDRLSAIPSDPDVRDHALLAYKLLEGNRREVVRLVADPSLGAPALLSNHLQLYKRWNETALLVEWYLLPFIERYGEADRRLTRFCRRIVEQAGWPLPPPLVAALSSQYYSTVVEFNLISAPAAAGTTLLDLPDLCHELGHILLLHHEAMLVGEFVQELADYIDREQRRVDDQQRPPEYRQLYDLLFAQWRDKWLREFVADMVATYLAGPAFGWQHVRLCAGTSRTAYHPALGETAEHPADEARLRGILAVSDQMGMAEACARIRVLWEQYLAVSGDAEPPEYAACYPQALVDSLASRTIEACRQIGLHGFDQLGDPPESGAIASILREAWERFVSDPEAYARWERERLKALWQDLGFSLESGPTTH